MTGRTLLALAAAAVLLTACGVGTPGEGEKIGQIVRVNRHGVFRKTHEAQIMRGGFQAGTGATGASFDFTIESDSLARVVEAAMRSQREVTIRYRSEGVYSAFRTESGGDFLVSIDTMPAHRVPVAGNVPATSAATTALGARATLSCVVVPDAR